jgi:hypothetical protein
MLVVIAATLATQVWQPCIAKKFKIVRREKRMGKVFIAAMALGIAVLIGLSVWVIAL